MKRRKNDNHEYIRMDSKLTDMRDSSYDMACRNILFMHAHPYGKGVHKQNVL